MYGIYEEMIDDIITLILQTMTLKELQMLYDLNKRWYRLTKAECARRRYRMVLLELPGNAVSYPDVYINYNSVDTEGGPPISPLIDAKCIYLHGDGSACCIPTQTLQKLICSVNCYEPFHRMGSYSQLQRLEINAAIFTTFHVEVISRCKELRELSLFSYEITDLLEIHLLKRLSNLVTLKLTHFRGTIISHPTIRKLVMDNCIVNSFMGNCRECTALVKLRIVGCRSMYDIGKYAPSTIKSLILDSSNIIITPSLLERYTQLEKLLVGEMRWGDYTFLTKLRAVYTRYLDGITVPRKCLLTTRQC
jgi:hypothetical protein